MERALIVDIVRGRRRPGTSESKCTGLISSSDESISNCWGDIWEASKFIVVKSFWGKELWVGLLWKEAGEIGGEKLLWLGKRGGGLLFFDTKFLINLRFFSARRIITG